MRRPAACELHDRPDKDEKKKGEYGDIDNAQRVGKIDKRLIEHSRLLSGPRHHDAKARHLSPPIPPEPALQSPDPRHRFAALSRGSVSRPFGC